MTWESVPFGQLAELNYGRALKAEDRVAGDFPVIGSGGIAGSHTTSLVTAPTIVVGRKGSIGSLTWAPDGCWPIDTAYYVSPKRDLNLRWLYWTMHSLGFERMNKSAAVPGLNRDDAYRALVPLPPLREQRRIAAILDEADSLRVRADKYRDELRAARDATFRATRSGDCCKRLLSDFVTRISSGKSVVGGDHGDDTRVLKISAVTSGVFREEEAKSLPDGYIPPAEHFVRAGDLLVSRANTEALVGASAYVWVEPSELRVLPDKLWRLSVEGIDPRYLHAVISAPDFRREVSRRATGSGGAMKNIGQRDYLSIPVSIAPRDTQRRFVEQLLELRRVEAAATARSACVSALFGALQSRAFRGEL